MSDITTAPRIRCDNCGIITEKEQSGSFSSIEWRKPAGRGGIRIDPTKQGTNPNHIAYVDLCPGCLSAVHKAVNSVLAGIRGEKP